ncbi:MAG: DUF835 domain-containing protein [Methanobacteriota archaeon]
MRLPWPLLLASGEDELLKSLLFGKKRDLEEGRAYLVKERKPQRAVVHFRRAIDRGFRPLLVTRQHPNHIERTWSGKEIRVVWLSTTLGKDYVDPHNLNSLTNLIANFVADGDRGAILLDGIEYLMMNNDFARILHFLEYVTEQVAIRRAILLVSIDDRAFDPKELALLERNLAVIE